MQARKQILKASLRGIAELHSRDVVHLGKIRTIRLRKLELNCFQI